MHQLQKGIYPRAPSALLRRLLKVDVPRTNLTFSDHRTVPGQLHAEVLQPIHRNIRRESDDRHGQESLFKAESGGLS
jgi:hypothetical protein